MPALATTCFPSGAEVFGLVRGMLNDADVPAIIPISPAGASRTGTITTITTSVAHGLLQGNIVQVQSVSDSSFSGTQIVATVPTSTTFTYVQPGLPNASSGNGIVSIVVQGDWAIDAVLLPLANKAYRKVQQRLLENGSKSATDEALITLPANATQLLDTTSPQLPVDFLAPRTIMERQSGSGLAYVPMSPCDELPSFADSSTRTWNRLWAWYLDGIYFPGSTVAMDIRLRYYIAMADISGADGVFTLRGSEDVIADYTAFLAVQSRNVELAQVFKSQFDEDMKEFLNMQNHARQYQPARRRPYNRRNGRSLGWIL